MRVFVTGTDTDAGKTVACAWLCLHSGADYWKPVQTGVTGDGPAPEGSDAAFVRAMTGARIHESLAVLPEPLSPHRAAELAGVTLEPEPIIVGGLD